ncbi:MAG: tRNA pseudouridine(55) synthase TruB [Gemmatimonadales bacterium]
MSDGILLIDKPAGPTSHDVVGAVRRALDIARVGHAGTLDPPATGLLVILVGRATRLARFVGLLRKRYTGTIRLGSETTTGDAEGEVVGERDESWRTRTRADLEQALAQVQAQDEQMPPPVSAKKVEGVRAYRRVRRGEMPVMKPVRVTIFSLQLSAFDASAGEASIAVECSAGTYIRSIARDVGRVLGTRAHLSSLRRTAIGPWNVEQAQQLRDVDAGLFAVRPEVLRPMREAVAHLPAVILSADDAKRLATGQKIAAPRDQAGPAAVFDAEGLIGVANVEDGLLHPDVVLVG